MSSAYQLCITALVAGILHYIWEHFHVVLYTGYEGISGAIPLTVWATIGDIGYVLFGVLLVCVAVGELAWLRAPQKHHYAVLAIIGFCIAVFVEYKAFAFDKWEYLPTMPIIPVLEVGLSPVVQMTLLLPLSVAIAVALRHKRSEKILTN